MDPIFMSHQIEVIVCGQSPSIWPWAQSTCENYTIEKYMLFHYTHGINSVRHKFVGHYYSVCILSSKCDALGKKVYQKSCNPFGENLNLKFLMRFEWDEGKMRKVLMSTVLETIALMFTKGIPNLSLRSFSLSISVPLSL